MKKILCLIMAIVLCLSIAGCGKEEVTYKLGETVSTERASVTLRDAKATIAIDNSGSWSSSSGHALSTYFTPVEEYEYGNPFAAPKGSTLVWFELEINNTDRDSLEVDQYFGGDIRFQIEYDGEIYMQDYDNTEVGVESIDGTTWYKYESSNILLMAGRQRFYRMYTEIPKEISPSDEFKIIVNLPNTDGKSDKFVYRINSKTEE